MGTRVFMYVSAKSVMGVLSFRLFGGRG